MNKLKTFCIALAASIACGASAQELYTIDVYDDNATNLKVRKPYGFRLDVGGGVSRLINNFDNSRIILNKTGWQFNVAPTYAFRTEDQALGLDIIMKRHNLENTFLMDKIDVDIFYIGPKYTWEFSKFEKGSVYLDVGVYWSRVREHARHIVLDNKFDHVLGASVSLGYALKLANWSRMFVRLSFMYSSYDSTGGMYIERDISGFTLSSGFWLFK